MNNQSSEIVSNSNNEAENEIASNTPQSESLQDTSEQILETQPVSVINAENNNSLELKKWLITSGVVILTLAVCILLSKENDVCFLSTCNEYSDSTATDLTSTSVGDDFIAYAGGAATLLVLTTLVGVPLLPAVAISTGIWFLVHLIH